MARDEGAVNVATHMDVDPKRVKTIVFDVDGTLYRQSPLRRAMLVRLLLHAATRPGSSLGTFRALRAYRHAQEILRGAAVEGALAAAQLRLACERAGQSEERVAPIVARWMEEEPLDILERFVEPALRTLLTEARTRGIRLGVFSDYPATAKLAAMRLSEFFEVVVTAQDPAVNRFKPDPSGLVEALRRLGTEPKSALYVGDRHDVDAPVAHAAGVPCVIVGGRTETKLPRSFASVSNYGELHSMLFSS
jgi:HAD superfamily hydrolase (TIGR01549 family)